MLAMLQHNRIAYFESICKKVSERVRADGSCNAQGSLHRGRRSDSLVRGVWPLALNRHTTWYCIAWSSARGSGASQAGEVRRRLLRALHATC